MSLKFDIPERCLLAQAAIYVNFGRPPIPDEIYLAAPDSFTIGPKELTRALRSKSIVARAHLSEAFREKSSWPGLSDWKIFSTWPLIDGIEIDSKLWVHEQIDFANSKLICANHIVSALYRVDPLDEEDVRSLPKSGINARSPVETAFAFWKITLPSAELFQLFPKWAPPPVTPPSRSRGGRPPKYRWEEFFAEIIVRADLDGLPNSQADLVSQMAEWCLEKWGTQPADSVLKERTAAIFQHIRKARKI